jgi:drug/metabolite transporter (DMT)-like permease
MDFIHYIQTYFTGEKNLGLFMIPIGIILIAFATYLWYAHKSPLGYGMLIPLILVGILGIGMGIGLAYQSQYRLKNFPKLFQTDENAFIERELPRMEKVLQNFPRLKLAWMIIIVIGLILLYFVKKDWLTGLSLSLILFGAIFLIIDSFAEKRAEIYTEKIRIIQQTE